MSGKSALTRNGAAALAAAAAGAVTGSGFLPGHSGWPLWFSLAPLFLVFMGRSPAGAFLTGWLFGFCAWAAGMSWLAAQISGYLGVPSWAGLAVFSLVCALHGLSFACFAFTVRFTARLLEKRLDWGEDTALFCAAVPAMAAVEQFFPLLFPVYLANTQVFHPPAIQIAELTGPSGPLLLIIASNISVYLLIRAAAGRGNGKTGFRRAIPAAGAALLLILANETYGRLRMRRVGEELAALRAAGATAVVAIIQASVPVEAAAGELNNPALELYRGMTAEAVRETGAELVIWPESVYGRIAGYEPAGGPGGTPVFTPGFRRTLLEDIPERTNILLNSRAEPAGSAPGRGRRFNAAYTVDPEKNLTGLVRKRRLFPFGEFIPFGERFPALYRFIPRAERLSAAAGPEVVTAKASLFDTGKKPRDLRLGVLICYEDLFPAESAALAGKGIDLLVDISNEIGFGYDTAPRQHLAFSALRAVETRKFFLRAANTGVSAIIDPRGLVTDSLAPGVRGRLYGAVTLSDRATFYSRHEVVIRWLGPVLLAVLLFYAWLIPFVRAFVRAKEKT